MKRYVYICSVFWKDVDRILTKEYISKWKNYGSRLVEKLRKYLNNLTKDTYASGELWEDYKKYTNQFEVIFTGEDKDSSSEDYEYISYNN